MMITAENGHNLLLSGQAGIGKSFLVDGLVRKLRSCGRKEWLFHQVEFHAQFLEMV